MQHRLEESGCRRPAPATLLIDVKGAAAFVVAGVEVRNGLDVGLFGGGAEGIEHVPAHARLLDRQFAAAAMQLAFAEEMIFMPLEKRQHIVPAPAGEPKLAPVIVVSGLTAHVDHGVDGG